MKVLYVCDRCGELYKDEATVLVLITPGKRVAIVGQENMTLEQWDNLTANLPNMVRHSHKGGYELGGKL